MQQPPQPCVHHQAYLELAYNYLPGMYSAEAFSMWTATNTLNYIYGCIKFSLSFLDTLTNSDPIKCQAYVTA